MSVNLHDQWLDLLKRHPHRIILRRTHQAPSTAKDLEKEVVRWHASLNNLAGIRGRIVGIALPNGLDWLAVFLALLRCEAVPMPLDPDTTEGAELVQALGGGALVSEKGLQSWTTRRHRLPPEICLAKLTSGSTGSPEAYFFSHAEMNADGRQIQRGMGIGPDDTNFAVIPFGHSYGLGNFIMPLLRSGCPIAAGRSILPRELVADLEATQATVFPAVPPIIRALASAELDRDQLAGVRLVICAGSLLPGEVARRFERRFRLPVHGFYGSTETGGISFDRGGDDTNRERSVGHPLPGVRVVRSSGGRLEVSSPAVHSHQNRRRGPEDNAAVLLMDRGRILNDDSVVLDGRIRGFIKRGGRRVSLGEIEAAALELPHVRQARAFALTRNNGEEDFGLILETSREVQDIRVLLQTRLPTWKRPARLVCLRRFPLNARGKSDLASLRIAAGI